MVRPWMTVDNLTSTRLTKLVWRTLMFMSINRRTIDWRELGQNFSSKVCECILIEYRLHVDALCVYFCRRILFLCDFCGKLGDFGDKSRRFFVFENFMNAPLSSNANDLTNGKTTLAVKFDTDGEHHGQCKTRQQFCDWRVTEGFLLYAPTVSLVPHKTRLVYDVMFYIALVVAERTYCTYMYTYIYILYIFIWK